MAKFKNIVGTGLLDYVQTQITEREKITTSQTREQEQLQWLSNRTGWFRLSSGVDVRPEGESLPEDKIYDTAGYGTLENLVYEANKGHKWARAKAQRILAEETRKLYVKDLAQKYILQSGTVSNKGDDTISKGGFYETYTQGPTDKLGYKPMPGITDVKVGTGGRWQTLMQADIDFVCYDLDQLNIMTKLYMSLGMTVFLEWGHTPYIDNNGKLITSTRPINFWDKTDKDELLQAVTKKRESTFGNYDAMVGTVYNFDWKANNDGSYSCSIKVMGPGGMVESLRINGSISIDYDNGKNIDSSKWSSTLGNALYALHNFLSKNEKLYQTTKSTYVMIGSSNGTISTTKNKFGKIAPDSFFESNTYNPTGKKNWFGADLKDKVTNSWGGILKNIYSSATYDKISFDEQTPGLVSYGNKFSSYGNAYQIVTGIAGEGNDGLDTIPADFYNGYATLFQTDSKEGLVSTYITLGHLMALIQHLGIFTESNEGITITPDASTDYSTTKPVVYIDYHPDNTIVQEGPFQCSVDPTKCLIPWNTELPLNTFFAPLDTTQENVYTWWGGIDKLGNKFKNFTDFPGRNKVNNNVPAYLGKIFNVLINLQFAYNTLELLSKNNTDRSVNLIEYINAILDGVNQSLGNVNNLRAFVGDDGKVLRIIDEAVVEKLTPEKLLTIPNFGLKSTVYDYGFSSKITPKLASQIVIAAQARDVGGIQNFPEEVLSYQSMNINILDRFSRSKIPAVVQESKDEDDSTGESLKTYQKLYDHIYYCYSLDEITNLGLQMGSISNLEKVYSDLQGYGKKIFEKTAGVTLIPLEFSLTMDGISGILPYNAFLIPNNRLPKKYRNRVAFAIFSINHNLGDNRWTTTLRGQTILLNQPVLSSNRNTVSPKGEASTPSEAEEIPTEFDRVVRESPEVDTGGSTVGSSKFNPKELSNGVPTQISTTNETSSNEIIPTTIDEDIKLAVPFIKEQEGFESEPYPDPKDDPNGRLSIGYGSDTITRPDGSFYKITRKSRVTEQDAERDLIRRIKTEFRPRVIQRLRDRGVDYNTVDKKLQVVFIDLAYNYGTLFYDFVEAYKANGKQGVIEELNNRIARFERGEKGQVKVRRIAEKQYLGG